VDGAHEGAVAAVSQGGDHEPHRVAQVLVPVLNLRYRAGVTLGTVRLWTLPDLFASFLGDMCNCSQQGGYSQLPHAAPKLTARAAQLSRASCTMLETTGVACVQTLPSITHLGVHHADHDRQVLWVPMRVLPVHAQLGQPREVAGLPLNLLVGKVLQGINIRKIRVSRNVSRYPDLDSWLCRDMQILHQRCPNAQSICNTYTLPCVLYFLRQDLCRQNDMLPVLRLQQGAGALSYLDYVPCMDVHHHQGREGGAVELWQLTSDLCGWAGEGGRSTGMFTC
jgi:hypothetical protein